jgi:hypothetical protein
VANGQVVNCLIELHQVAWSIQGVQFVSNLKVNPLPCYDLIMGMDWLECHNPMKVNWLNKWMIVNHGGTVVQLHRLQPSMPGFSLVEVLLIQDSVNSLATACFSQSPIPLPIKRLLESFDHMFADSGGARIESQGGS